MKATHCKVQFLGCQGNWRTHKTFFGDDCAVKALDYARDLCKRSNQQIRVMRYGSDELEI